jgi:hypothetical protein
MRTTRRRSQGFTLIATLLMLLLLSGIAIGLMMMVNSEGRVGGADLQSNIAYHSAEGGIEKMTSDLSSAFQSAQAPTPADICALSNLQPYMSGVTWKDYQVQPASGCSAPLSNNFGQIQSGPNQGLWAQLVPVTMLATAAQPGGQEVSMIRTAQVALIPVFQFGVFSDSDVGFYASPDLTFAGRVHTNGDLYVGVATNSKLTFKDKLDAFGNVVRQNLPNGLSSSGNNNTGTVLIPTASGGCNAGVVSGTCRAIGLSEGSVTGMGGNPPQSSQNSNWPSISLSTYNAEIIDANYGNTGGTGAKNLKMPFVNDTTHPYEIIRRPTPSDSTALGQSREYNMAQIRILLSDDPGELPGGSTDSENVRLANVTGASPSNPYGIPTPTVSAWSFPPYTGVGAPPFPPAGSTYNLYFASATQALPDETPCNNSNCGTTAAPLNPPMSADWASAPAAHPAGDDLVVPPNIPILNNPGATAPPFALCPPDNINVAVPPGCPATPAIPYYATNGALPYPLPANAATWSLIDGWLRVEYKDAAGTWHPVTNEWLQLGFARGVNPPTTAGGNTVNPNAILIFQQPADRYGDGQIDYNGLAPKCTATSKTTGKCTAWNYGRPPEVVSDLTALGAGSNSAYFGLTNAGTATQSMSMFNWYPINFYDTREGEPRDVKQANNSCTANGVMNAVEIDVGNLKRWLWGDIPGSGTDVDFVAQNGYVLYFSDRRGMLKNPNAANTKSGDSGLEDSVNRAVASGAPDGVLDPIPIGKQFSPEDVNQNKLLDSFGPKNEGLGFYNVSAPNAGNINAGIQAAAPDNPYAPRINSCGLTGRKNWVSGARHVLKLVDGSLGNVPLRKDLVNAAASLAGGFTVASENPVYIQGDYNSNNADPIWGGGNDVIAKHANAAVIADAVTILSNNWKDRISMTATPSDATTRPASTTYYRVAIAGGKNMNFPFPNWESSTNFGTGTDGGVHNFLRFLENWSGQQLNYEGSLVSLYYATYNTGTFKCCTYSVYQPPVRNYIFDADFAKPLGLPPGTPLFRDVDTLGYRQLFTTRSY